jgi:flagellar basal-body rod modification protein FlgD
MASIDSVGSTTTANGASQLASTSDRATISRAEFLKLLVAELVNQDPFKPIDNADMAGQMAQIQSLQTSSDLSNGFKSMSASFQALALREDMAAAGTMIGRVISGLTADGTSVQGLVGSVKLQDGTVNLMVNGAAVPISSVSEITPYTTYASGS